MSIKLIKDQAPEWAHYFDVFEGSVVYMSKGKNEKGEYLFSSNGWEYYGDEDEFNICKTPLYSEGNPSEPESVCVGGIKTTHELAKQLLEMEDVPVLHHYWHMDDFSDDGFDYLGEVSISKCKGKVVITTGNPIEGDL